MTSDVEFLVGFETEFILLKSIEPIEAVNIHDWTASGALPSGSVEATVMQEIAKSLEGSGVELQMYHAEAAPGQVMTSILFGDSGLTLISFLVRGCHRPSDAP